MNISFSAKKIRTPFLFFSLIFFLLNSNFRSSNSEDLQALIYLPFSILQEGNVDLDEFPFLYPSYRITEQSGHQFSTFPILTAILATPFYAPFIWFGGQANEFSVALLSKLVASFFVTLSCLFVFLTLRSQGERPAYWAVLCYSLGSGLWSILAQDLESQTGGVLIHSIILYFLFSSPPLKTTKCFWIGVCLGIAMGIRQSNLISALGIVFILLIHLGKKAFFPLLFGTILGYLPQLYLNLTLYGDLLGGYGANHQLWGFRMNPTTGHYFSHPIGWGILGLLGSPSRGILIYSPWLFFFSAGYRLRWREGGLSRLLLIPVIAHLLFYASFWNWPGGVHYGGRFLLDVFPYVIYLCFPIFQRPSFLLKISIGIALIIQAIGVYGYENSGPYSWDLTPIHTIHQPSRYWDFYDNQIWRTCNNLKYAQELFCFPSLALRSQRILKYERETIRYYSHLLQSALKQQNISQAEQLLAHASQFGKTDELYEFEGKIRLAQGRLLEAINAFENGYRFSQHIPCLIQAAHLYRKTQQYQRGNLLLQEAERKLSLFYQPPYLRGLLLREAGDLQNAIEAFQEALKRKPTQAEILLELGTLWLEIQHFSKNEEALKQLELPLTSYNEAMLHQGLQSSNRFRRCWAALLLFRLGKRSVALHEILLQIEVETATPFKKLLQIVSWKPQ